MPPNAGEYVMQLDVDGGKRQKSSLFVNCMYVCMYVCKYVSMYMSMYVCMLGFYLDNIYGCMCIYDYISILKLLSCMYVCLE